MAQEAYVIFKTTPFDGYKLGSGFSGKKMEANYSKYPILTIRYLTMGGDGCKMYSYLT